MLERARRLRRGIGCAQQLVDGLEILTEPGMQAVTDAVHLAKAGRGGERHGIQIIQDDASTGRPRILAVQIGTQAGGRHLHQLVPDGQGQAVGRMPVFLDLGRQRRSSRHIARRVDRLEHLFQDRLPEPVPFHRRIALGVIWIEQFTVLDEQQGIGDHRRDRVEVGVGMAWKAMALQLLAATIEQGQAGDRFLGIRQEQAEIVDPRHVRRDARLFGDLEALRLEAGQEIGQARVSQTDIVRTGLGRPSVRILARFQLKGQALAIAGQHHRLKRGSDQLVGGDQGTRQHRHTQQQPWPDPPPARAGSRPGGRGGNGRRGHQERTLESGRALNIPETHPASHVAAGSPYTGAPPAIPARVASHNAISPAAASTSGSIRCDRRIAGRTACRGRTPG